MDIYGHNVIEFEHSTLCNVGRRGLAHAEPQVYTYSALSTKSKDAQEQVTTPPDD